MSCICTLACVQMEEICNSWLTHHHPTPPIWNTLLLRRERKKYNCLNEYFPSFSLFLFSYDFLPCFTLPLNPLFLHSVLNSPLPSIFHLFFTIFISKLSSFLSIIFLFSIFFIFFLLLLLACLFFWLYIFPHTLKPNHF